jgi:maltooligosyltrehalose trehalohydrolase
LDAVHALKDDSPVHFLVELAETVRTRLVGRYIHLMLENEANQASFLERRSKRTPLYDAQWGDDYHNALHVLLTGDKEGYYRAFADKPLQHLARSLAEGFAYQGEQFVLHDKPRGEKSSHLPPEATIFFAQNHDQVGNRALGERLSRLVGSVKLRQAMAITLLSPHIPLLFMGEEAAAETPFLFFCDWEGEAADLTREGRRKEFAHFSAFSTSEMRDKIPDPTDETTFLSSRLDWASIDHAPRSREFRAFTRELLRLRREKIIPMIKLGFVHATTDLIGGSRSPPEAFNITWETSTGKRLQILTSFASSTLVMPELESELVFASEKLGQSAVLHPNQVVVAVGR